MTDDQDELPELKNIGDIFNATVNKLAEMVYRLSGEDRQLSAALVNAVAERYRSLNHVSFVNHVVATERQEEEKAKPPTPSTED